MSMNMSTSWPRSSLKYSAIVRPVSPTRARTPGGSFICPKTRDGVVQDAGLLHLVPEIVALSGALPYTGEHRHALVDGANVADKLLNDDRLAHSGAAVCADFAAFGERRDEVHDLQAGFEYFDLGGLLLEAGRIAVNGPGDTAIDLFQVVERLSEAVKQAAERRVSDGNGHRPAGVDHIHAADESLGGTQGKTTRPAIAHVLLHLEHQLVAGYFGFEGVVDGGHVIRRELDVHDRTDNLGDPSVCHVFSPLRVKCLNCDLWDYGISLIWLRLHCGGTADNV